MHDQFMRRCFELARRGLGQVSPNPLVGAVIVNDGRIIGEGWHKKHGAPHAEPDAFANATEDVTGATLYVNLEPCCHTKKLTPPCAPLVIQKKIARVVLSNLDPNPSVAGQGVQQLRDAGIEVITGVLEAEGEVLNEIFFHRMRTGLPFVHLKTAISADGKTAWPDGRSKWITGPESRLDAHWGRLTCDAIVVGAETVRADDPALTVRIPGQEVPRAPWRIVVTASGNLPATAQLFTDFLKDKTLVVTGERTPITVVPESQVLRLQQLSPFPFDEFYKLLAARGIHSLWLEGGAQLHSLFLENGQVHRVTLYQAPVVIGEGKAMWTLRGTPITSRPNLRNLSRKSLGADEKFSGIPE